MKTVVFGAFDRHNLGDLLFARIAGREEPGPLIYAGLAGRDLRPWGGPLVQPLAEAVADGPVRLIHAGGELLDCDEAQAAFMLGEPSLRWGRPAPYVVAKAGLATGSTVEFRAVGGVSLAGRPADFRHEVLAALGQADRLTVRDRTTQACLAAHGVQAALAPDPAMRVADLFGYEILTRRPAETGYSAVQFAADWGDDATLDQLAAGLDHLGLPVALFRAGAAPWHDDLEPYRRLADRLRVPATLFESLHIWDICGLIAGAGRFVGTSLHGRIVAEAFGIPAVSLEQTDGSAAKVRAWLATWLPGAAPLALADFARAP